MTVLNELEKIAQIALDEAKKCGADEADVMLSRSQGFDVNVYAGDVDKLEHQNDQNIVVTLYRDHQKGSSSGTDYREEAVRTMVRRANDIAKHASRDEFAGLAQPEALATHPQDFDLYHPWDLTVEAAIALAKRCERIGLNADKHIKGSDGVGVNTNKAFFVHANSHGFVNAAKSTSHDIACVLLAENKAGMERDYDYDSKRDAKDLRDVGEIAENAAHRAVHRLSPRSLKTCKVPVLFTPEIARHLIRQFLAAIRGSRLYRKSSFLLDSLNKPIFPDFMQIHENPFLKKGMGSCWCDADGIPTAPKHFVRDGVLESYLLGVYSARKLGMQPTGNADGVHNLLVEPTAGDQNALIKQMDRGVMICDLLGHGGNLVTGDYSSGAFGYWVEGGDIQYPVSGITIAGHLKDMFKHLVAVGNDIDERSNVRSGSILLDAMTISGL